MKEINAIIKDYYEQLQTNELKNIEEMDKFLETYNIPRLKKEEKDNLKNQLLVLKVNHQAKSSNKSPRSDSFTGGYHQTFKE